MTLILDVPITVLPSHQKPSIHIEFHLIEYDSRYGRETILVSGRNENGWKYAKSVMPTGHCADWAEKFWDCAYLSFQQALS